MIPVETGSTALTRGENCVEMSAVNRRSLFWPTVLAYGFRSFFLLAGLQATLFIPVWLLILLGDGGFTPVLSPLAWHAHEMLFGFIAAALAGFLLTAIPSWTGQRGFAGAPLLLLVLLWMAGRLVTTLALLAFLSFVNIVRLVTTETVNRKVFLVYIAAMASVTQQLLVLPL